LCPVLFGHLNLKNPKTLKNLKKPKKNLKPKKTFSKKPRFFPALILPVLVILLRILSVKLSFMIYL